MALRRDSFAFTAFLGTLTALPPLSIDMGLPGLPAIEASFADAAGRGPLTLSTFANRRMMPAPLRAAE